MGLIKAIFGRSESDDPGALYAAIVAEARRPGWYLAAQVPDTIDGRFDMVLLILSLVLLRLERDEANDAAARLTEAFVADMDGTMREIGFGDLVVGKRVGGMMGALGGRLGAYRGGVTRAALVRNLYRGACPSDAALDAAVVGAVAVEARLAALPLAEVLAGGIG